MKRTFENCTYRKMLIGPRGMFNDTEKNDKGQCKGFTNIGEQTMQECKNCELWEGKDEINRRRNIKK